MVTEYLYFGIIYAIAVLTGGLIYGTCWPAPPPARITIDEYDGYNLILVECNGEKHLYLQLTFDGTQLNRDYYGSPR